MDPRPAFHYHAEDVEDEQVSGGLNHLVQRNVPGAQWTWKKITVVVDSGGAENVMPMIGHSTGANSRVRGMASTGRRLRAEVVDDPAIALQPIFATPERCKDVKELKERLTAWSLKVAEYKYQFKAIDEAQKTFVVREMMPKDIKREFLTGPRIDEIMEKLEIIINEMMADDGPVPMDLVNVGTHDAKMTQSDSDTSNDMSYEDVCAFAWKGYKASKGAGKKGPNGSVTWDRRKGADEWTSGTRDDGGTKGGKMGSKGSKTVWYGEKEGNVKRKNVAILAQAIWAQGVFAQMCVASFVAWRPRGGHQPSTFGVDRAHHDGCGAASPGRDTNTWQHSDPDCLASVRFGTHDGHCDGP